MSKESATPTSPSSALLRDEALGTGRKMVRLDMALLGGQKTSESMRNKERLRDYSRLKSRDTILD